MNGAWGVGVGRGPVGVSDIGLQEAYQGWLARHGFVAKIRRCRPIIVNVGSKAFLANECPSQLSGVTLNVDAALATPGSCGDHTSRAGIMCGDGGGGGGGIEDMGGLWLQHQVAFKGLPQQPVGFD
jgi:hypothetical protein